MNLWQMPRNSLKYLLCENGQADTTKTTETVIFDNTNPNHCPLGYEIYREISVCHEFSLDGKNRCLITGRTLDSKRSAKFFTPVRLDVDNPNILIRNERITKMLNKNPTEVNCFQLGFRILFFYFIKKDSSF